MLTSHPIQYQAPLWRALADELGKGHGARGVRKGDYEPGGGVPFEVWFLTDQGVRQTEDRDFGKAFAWDVDLLFGYPHRFLARRGAFNLRKFNGILLAKPIGEALREANATALWAEGWRFKPFWDAVSAAKKMEIPVFLRGETSDKIAEKGGLFVLARNFALHRLFAKVDYFLAIGQASRRFYLKHGVPEGKLIDAPYGVDNEFFRAEAGKIRGTRHVARGERGGGQGTGGQGADFDRCDFENLTDGQKAIREEWGIPLEAKVVMFCGKFVRKKRPLDVVEAVRLLAGKAETLKYRNTEIRPYHLLFVGSGELGDELRAACDVVYDAECAQSADQRTKGPKDEEILEARGEGGSGSASGSMLHAPCFAYGPSRQASVLPPATFAGFLNQSQISKAYAVADVVVLPSEAWETWGLVVNEATAAGVPTVVSDACGCAEDFGANNPYTRVFPMGNVAAMARAIEEVLALEAQPEDVTRYAEAFSPRITAEAVAQCLRERR